MSFRRFFQGIATQNKVGIVTNPTGDKEERGFILSVFSITETLFEINQTSEIRKGKVLATCNRSN